MKALTICIFLVIYGRMLEVYLLTSLANPPRNDGEPRWGGMGQNYLRSLLARVFKPFSS